MTKKVTTRAGALRNELVVPIVLMGGEDDKGKVPRTVYEGDAGCDLYNVDDTIVAPGTRAQLKTNIKVAIPANMFGLLLARSSAFHNKGLIAHTAIIDPGYRGEIKVLVHNPTHGGIHVMAGERVAQMVVVPFVPVRFKEVEKLPPSERGDRGFGSSRGYEGARAVNPSGGS